MLRKSLFVAIFLTTACLPFAQSAHALTAEDEASIQALVQQITDLQIQVYVAQITELQAQIATLIAAQASTTQAIADLQQSTPVAPVVFGAIPEPVTLAIGEVKCFPFSSRIPGLGAQVFAPFEITGDWDHVAVTYDNYIISDYNTGDVHIAGTRPFPRAKITKVSVNRKDSKLPVLPLFNVPGDYHVNATAYNSSNAALATASSTITVANQCPQNGLVHYDVDDEQN